MEQHWAKLLVFLAAVMGSCCRPLDAAAPDSQADTQKTSKTDHIGDPLPDGAILRLGTLRLRQGQGVEGVRFSPDGKYLVSTGWDDSIRFWDVTNGRQVHRLKTAEGDGTFGVAFSPDGTKLASVGERGLIRLWDLNTGQVLFKVVGHKERSYGVRTYGVAFSPDGTTFATAGADNSVRLWDVASGVELLELQTEEGGSNARPVAFSPDGTLLASGTRGGTIHIWNLGEGGEPKVIPKAHGREVVSLAFSADGERLFSSGSRLERKGDSWTTFSEICLWDVSSSNKTDSFEADEELLGEPTIVLSRDGMILVSSHYEKIVIWDVKSKRPIRVLRGEPVHYGGRSHALAISPDNRLIASKARDHKVYLWSAETGTPVLAQPDTHTRGVISVAYSPDGSLIATGSEDATVRLWNAESGEFVRLLSKGSGWVRYLEFLPDGRRLVLGAETQEPEKARFEGEVKICRIEDGEVRQRFPTSDRVMCGRLSSDGHLLAIATGLGISFQREPSKCEVHVWDLVSGSKISEMSGHQGRIIQLAFSDERFLWSASEDQTIRKWNLKTGEELDRIDLSPAEGRRAFLQALVATTAERLIFGDLQPMDDPQSHRGELRTQPLTKNAAALWKKTFSNQFPSVMAISPDGSTLAVYLRATSSSQMENCISIWSVDRGEELLSFTLADNSVRSLAFSPDGTKLLSGMDLGDTLVWDLSTATHSRE